MMPHPALAGLQPPSAAALSAAGMAPSSSAAAGMAPSNSAAAGLLTLSAAGSLASAASAANANNSASHLPGVVSALAKESSHRDSSDKRASNDDRRERNSFSPHNERAHHRSRSPSDTDTKPKRRRETDKNDHGSEDEKSDQDLVVDVANEDPTSPHNGDASPRDNGTDARIKRERPPSRSGSSSNSSTPLSTKPKEHLVCIAALNHNKLKYYCF
jgi:groucho